MARLAGRFPMTGAFVTGPFEGRSLAAMLLAALLLAVPLSLPSPAAHAQEAGHARESALLVPGKTTVFERIITRPAARLVDAAAATARVVAERLDPFSIYYVYERQNGYVRVGVGPRSGAVGWILAEQTIAWRQSIVVAFRDRTISRLDRTLMFRDRDTITGVLHDSDAPAMVRRLRQDAAAGRTSSSVVAIEPERYVDIQSPGSFYLFPILRAEAQTVPGYDEVKFLEVASIPERSQRRPPARNPAQFRAGVTIVMDTTLSMGPYIDGTRNAMADIARRVHQSPVGQNVRFGLVGFRQPPESNPGIEYGTKVFLPLQEDSTIDRFLTAIDEMAEAKVSTDGFNEDAIGGLHEALRSQQDRAAFGAHFVILVTDAGPRLPDGATRLRAGAMAPRELASLARENKVHLTVVHLKTPAGKNNHSYAEAQYKIVAENDGARDYIPIVNGDPKNFDRTIASIAKGIVDNTQRAMDGQVVSEPAANDNSSEANRNRAFRAMQLAYLGSETASDIPDVVRSWMLDRDLDGSQNMAVDVRLLITKNQLSSLSAVLARIIEVGDRPLTNSSRDSLIPNLQRAIGMIATDGAGFVRGDYRDMGDALGEYLKDLPYHSEVTGRTMAEWASMPPTEFRMFQEQLRSKRVFYDSIHNDPNLWIRLHPNAPDGESVTTIRLSDLP